MISWLKENNVAVITGGANGIGRSAVDAFLAQGLHVVAIDRDDQALGDLKAAAVDASKLMVVTCDVSDYAAMTDVRDQVLARFGRVDCLMNNAGAMVTRGLPWEDLEGWKAQVDINLWGIIHGCHAFLPGMVEQDTPSAVINTGSKQGITNPPGGYAYNLSKAGVLAYTQSLAHALRQTEGCQVNTHLLVPGLTYSSMIQRFVPEKPPGAWTTQQVIEFMLAEIQKDAFLILCPDNDTPRRLDERRIQWNTDDLIEGRPALSRWHPDYAQEYNAFVEGPD